MNKPKRMPQNYETMLTEAEMKKPSRVYRAESGEYVNGELSRLVTMGTMELARACDDGKPIPLTDTRRVKEKAIELLRVCEETSTLPTIGGLARALGYSIEGVRLFRRDKPEHETTAFLEMYHDLCTDLLSEAALRNLTNSVYSIFIQKARNGLEDKVIVEPVINQPYGPAKTTDELAERYINIETIETEAEL